MLLFYLIIIIFIASMVFSFIEDSLTSSQKKIVVSSFTVIMILMATTKDIHHVADAIVYEDMFYNYDTFLVKLSTEPTFIYICKVVIALGGTIATVFFIYALLSVPTKLYVYYKATPYIFTSLVIYIPTYYELHDLIQIRAAVAGAFAVASILPLSKKNYLGAFLLIAGGTMFHFSAAVFFPILFIGNYKLNKVLRIIIACLFPCFFLMYWKNVDLSSFIPPSLLWGKIAYYKNLNDGTITHLHRDGYFMVKCAMMYVCLYYYDLLVKKNQLAQLVLYFFFISIFFILGFNTIPVLASRVSDLFGIIDGIVFSYCLYIISPRYVARSFVALIGIYKFMYNFLYMGYFN